MGPASSPNVTQLLAAWREGDPNAFEKLAPAIHQELHRAAHHYMAGERPGHVLQTTALVNEAYLRLVDWKDVKWQNRAHFFGVAATMMRRILVDYARELESAKRGGRAFRVSLSDVAELPLERAADVIALDDALNALAAFDPRKSRVVELRYFGGLSLEETAAALDVSVATVRRDWSLARAWLYRELASAADASGRPTREQ